MSVFTHGVDSQGKPAMINRNQVFPVADRIKMLRGFSPRFLSCMPRGGLFAIAMFKRL
jgi:hypothetical protein